MRLIKYVVGVGLSVVGLLMAIGFGIKSCADMSVVADEQSAHTANMITYVGLGLGAVMLVAGSFLMATVGPNSRGR